MSTEDTFTDRLSDYLDGELTPGEAAEVEAHLRGCSNCRTVVAELRAVVEQAQALPARPPDADLWPGVEARLDRARGWPSFGGARQAPAPWRISFTVPQLAAAALALMVLSGGLVWMARSGDTRADLPPLSAGSVSDSMLAPANFGDAQYDQAVRDLESMLAAGRASLDPETIRVLEENLRAIDAAIDQSRRALARDPANTYLNSHLAGARQRKLALLRRASVLASDM
jgi:predicted anti-sigma-YlaC factor YlaD